MRCWMETTTPPEAADRNELQQHTASAVVAGGAAGVYDQGGDEEQHNEEMVLVDAEQVDDDELLNARVRVWWPSLQTWRIGDVIAYRQGPTEQSLQQHFIPHDGYLVKYLDDEGGGNLRWHALWEPDEVWMFVDQPVTYVRAVLDPSPNVFSTPPRTTPNGSSSNEGSTAAGGEQHDVDETRRKFQRTKGGAKPALEYVMDSETLVSSRLLDYVPGITRRPSGQRLPVAHRVQRLQLRGKTISNTIPDPDSARVLIALNITMPDPDKACLVHGIIEDRKLSSVIPTFETLQDIINDSGIDRALVDTHFAISHPSLSAFAKITMAISGWRRSESFQFMGRCFLLDRENNWKGNVKAENYHFETFNQNQNGQVQKDFEAVIEFLKAKNRM